jgi:hypothetical protein
MPFILKGLVAFRRVQYSPHKVRQGREHCRKYSKLYRLVMYTGDFYFLRQLLERSVREVWKARGHIFPAKSLR